MRLQYDASGLAPATAAPRFLLPDGTLWSHAAVLGDFVKGAEFSITADVVRSMAANLASGYPSRVPMDYDHASTSSDPVAREARYAGNAPKAGTVLEARAVLTPADYPETAAAQVDAAGMETEQGFGLWVRWKPTPKALMHVLNGEYTELSVCFDDAHDDKHGNAQGPTLLAVALLNRPFLDTLTPVAASADSEHTHRRADDPPPADAARDDAATTADAQARHSQRGTMDIRTSLSAALGKPVAENEAEGAVRELAARVTAHNADAEMGRALGALIPGATAEAKAAHVRALTAEVETARTAAAEARTRELGAQVDGIIAANRNKITPAREPAIREVLTRELSAGTKAGETVTEFGLSSAPVIEGLEQASAGDQGESLNDDQRLALAVKNEETKALSALREHASPSEINEARARAISAARASLSAR